MSKMEKSSEIVLRSLVALVAGPRNWDDTRESWLNRAAKRAGIGYRTIKAAFYGEITDSHHPAAERLRDAAAKAAKTEAQELAQRFETMAHAMRSSDPDFYGADADALVDAARALRGMDRTRND